MLGNNRICQVIAHCRRGNTCITVGQFFDDQSCGYGVNLKSLNRFRDAQIQNSEVPCLLDNFPGKSMVLL